jgi:hypothetical protein
VDLLPWDGRLDITVTSRDGTARVTYSEPESCCDSLYSVLVVRAERGSSRTPHLLKSARVTDGYVGCKIIYIYFVKICDFRTLVPPDLREFRR